MMKKLILATIFAVTLIWEQAYAQTAEQLHETAKSFMKQGDYANAVLVLNKSLQKAPENMGVAKDLAMSYYFQKDNIKALETIKPVLDSKDADDQCFQIAGSIYKQLDQKNELEKLYKKGIKKFPESGPLYNELGESVFTNNKLEAIKYWEKGIQSDPGYSKNYFNAARYYFFTTDKIWSILYGEIFINMEPTGSSTPEMKQILLDSYKKLFTETDLEKINKDKNSFVKNYLEIMNKQVSLTNAGVNAEVLSMVRARFIIDWFVTDTKPAFKLFSLHQQLLKEGMFEAYNQWLFGATENLSAYENWIKTHSAENAAFIALQKSRMFKVPTNQYYH